MTPTHTGTVPSARRRSSLHLRSRPRTAAPGGTVPQVPALPLTGVWSSQQDGSYNNHAREHEHEHENELERRTFDGYQDVEDTVLEETTMAPAPVGRRRPKSLSFSSLRHSVDGLRALGRRLSVTLRTKSSKHALRTSHEEANPDEAATRHQLAGGSWEGRSRNAWFKGHSINRRPSLHSVTALQSFYAPPGYTSAPIPGNGSEPPILPFDLSGGAAARAAAAALNEMAKAERIAFRGDSNIFDVKLIRDSESGIGIDIRDHSELSESELAVVRIDPVHYLPTELMAQILSYLDPQSLMRAELVSRSWREAASSHHVWRNVFRREFGRRQHSGTTTKRKKQSAGLGKTLPNQDWKRMFMVRQALERRWKEGKAAAIYLHGHTDSVYCVQFDENKIITGSRDRTIRIWDAHYPWTCLKIIGPPPGDMTGLGANMPANHAVPSPGRSPFLTICPPCRPAAGIAAPLEDASNYHSASILCLQYDDEIMVTGSSDFTCIVWDVRNDYKPIRRLVGHKAGVLDVCFDDRYIVSCSKDTTICVWDRHTGELVKRLIGHRGPVNAVQLRGDLIVSASGDGVAKLWNITSGLCIKEFQSKDRGLACVEFSEDARTILAGGNDQVIYQFDANTGELVNEMKGHTGLVRSLHLDCLNNRVVSGSYDMSVKVFDATSGELMIDLPGWTTSWMLSAKSDYRRIVATSQDSRAVIMDFGYGLDGIELLEEE